MKNRAAYVFWLAITIIPIFGLIWSVISPKDFEYWQTLSRQYITLFGYFGPLFFILLQVLQVVVTPLSHYTVGAIGGYLYGPYLGGILNYIGRVIGHIIAFTLAKKYGRRWILKWVGEDTLTKYDRIFSGETNTNKMTIQHLILFLIYFLPLFPDDEISYLVGASNMSKKPFVLANLFGHLGGAFSLAYIGSGINTKDTLFWILTITTLAGFPAIWAAMTLHIKKNTKS
jgi:uncharacterized membrane protein YdjX (TVP38/TMEM64 family)